MSATAWSSSTTLREDPAAEAERLFAEHADALLRYCTRQLGSRTQGEDAVQTKFLYALRALGRGVVPRV